MTDTTPDLATRLDDALLSVFREAFEGVEVYSFTSPGERSHSCIGIKTEVGQENPIGTNLFDVSVDIQARNLSAGQVQLLADMVGNSWSARETIERYSAGQFVMPRGQAVEMVGATRTTEDQDERVVTHSLIASIQPI